MKSVNITIPGSSKQVVLAADQTVMVRDGLVYLPFKAEELLYIIQEYQKEFGPIKVHTGFGDWRGFYGVPE